MLLDTRGNTGLLDAACPIDWTHPRNAGLVGMWAAPGGYAGGSKLPDLTRLGDASRHGTLTNGPTWGGGPNGLAELSFVSASSQSVNCGTPDGLNGATQAAYACWISKSSNAVTAGLGGSAGSSAGGNRFSTIWFTDGSMYIVAEYATPTYGFAAVPVGRRRLMVAYDGGGAGNSTRLRAWIDGSPLAMNYSGTIPAALGVVGPWTLGKDSSNRFCGGKIGDTSLWLGRGFSNADAAADYDQASRGYPDTLRWLRPWSFGVDVGGGGGTFTATAALTVGAATLAGTAAHTTPTYTGSAAVSVAPATASGSATHAAPTYTGAAAVSTAPATLAGSATFAPGTKTASAALSAAPAATSGSATFAAGTKTATATLTAAPADLDGTATFAGGTKTGSAALGVAPATLAGSATFTAPTYTGAATLAVAPATLAGVGVFATAVFQGSAALAAGNAELAGTATFAARFAGAAALTAGAAALAATATHVAPTYTGSATLTAGAATLSGAGVFSTALRTATASLTSGAALFAGTATYVAGPTGPVTRTIAGTWAAPTLTGTWEARSLTGTWE